MGSHKLPVVAVCGATGTGKSKLAIDLARRLNSEVINADAVQLYKGLNIATNKVTQEETGGIIHHLLGCLDPIEGFRYNVHHYRRDCSHLIKTMKSRNKCPLLVGGTHYYLEAVLWSDFLRSSEEFQYLVEPLDGACSAEPNRPWPPELFARLPNDPKDYYAALMNTDPEMAMRLHPNDMRKLQQALLINLTRKKGYDSSQKTSDSCRRSMCPRFPPPDSLIFWLDADPIVLRSRLDERVAKMVNRGLIQELDEFLIATAKSLLPSKVAVKSDGGVSEEAKKAIFQLANEGLLPSVGTEHWCRGVLQSIGFKEFEDFLQLSSVDRQSEIGQAKLNAAIEHMKTATRQYARRQVGWIRNRFLRRPAVGGIPVYRIDVTPILTASTPEIAQSLWNGRVVEPCLATLLENSSPPALSPEPFIEPAFSSLLKSSVIPPPPYICASCNGRIFVNYLQFQDHLKSRAHKKRLASLKRKTSIPTSNFVNRST